MIEEKLRLIKPGKKITIWIDLSKGNDGKERQRIVKGKVVAIYKKNDPCSCKSEKRKILQRML